MRQDEIQNKFHSMTTSMILLLIHIKPNRKYHQNTKLLLKMLITVNASIDFFSLFLIVFMYKKIIVFCTCVTQQFLQFFWKQITQVRCELNWDNNFKTESFRNISFKFIRNTEILHRHLIHN